MANAYVYLLTATCDVNGAQQERRYIGTFKVHGNQTKESARRLREEYHRTLPVAWLRSASADSMNMQPIGHCMRLQDALLEEAIQSATAFTDGGAPCRGGPWAHPHIGAKGLAEANTVRRLTSQATSPKEARGAVMQYAQGLGEKSYLRKHCLDLAFSKDSAENHMAPPRPPKRRSSGKSQSGNRKRQSWGMRPGTAKYNRHKWGSDVKANRKRDNLKQRG